MVARHGHEMPNTCINWNHKNAIFFAVPSFSVVQKMTATAHLYWTGSRSFAATTRQLDRTHLMMDADKRCAGPTGNKKGLGWVSLIDRMRP